MGLWPPGSCVARLAPAAGRLPSLIDWLVLLPARLGAALSAGFRCAVAERLGSRADAELSLSWRALPRRASPRGPGARGARAAAVESHPMDGVDHGGDGRPAASPHFDASQIASALHAGVPGVALALLSSPGPCTAALAALPRAGDRPASDTDLAFGARARTSCRPPARGPRDASPPPRAPGAPAPARPCPALRRAPRSRSAPRRRSRTAPPLPERTPQCRPTRAGLRGVGLRNPPLLWSAPPECLRESGHFGLPSRASRRPRRFGTAAPLLERAACCVRSSVFTAFSCLSKTSEPCLGLMSLAWVLRWPSRRGSWPGRGRHQAPRTAGPCGPAGAIAGLSPPRCAAAHAGEVA